MPGSGCWSSPMRIWLPAPPGASRCRSGWFPCSTIRQPRHSRQGRPASARTGAQERGGEVQRERVLAHGRRADEEHGVGHVGGEHGVDGRHGGRLADGAEPVHAAVARGRRGSALGGRGGLAGRRPALRCRCGCRLGGGGLRDGASAAGAALRVVVRRFGAAAGARLGGGGLRDRCLGGRGGLAGRRPALRGRGGCSASVAAASATGASAAGAALRVVVRRFGAAAGARLGGGGLRDRCLGGRGGLAGRRPALRCCCGCRLGLAAVAAGARSAGLPRCIWARRISSSSGGTSLHSSPPLLRGGRSTRSGRPPRAGCCPPRPPLGPLTGPRPPWPERDGSA